MPNHVVPAFTRAVVLTERGVGGLFRKVFCQNQLNGCRTENVSSLAKRFLVISKCGGSSKKSEIFMNLANVLQRSRNALNLLYFNSNKSFLSSSANAPEAKKKEEKVAIKKREISYDDLKEFIKEDGKILFDVREPNEVAQSGMLPSAINLPLSKLKCSLLMSAEEFKSEYNVEKPSKSHPVVFYGLAFVKGATAVEIANKLGYTKSRYYPGGYEEWKKRQQA